MALETATYIDGLNASNPAASDAISTADDHLRLIKAAIKATFPNITGPVTKTQAELNGLLTTAGATMTGPLVLAGNPTENLQAATKQYVDSITAGSGGSVPSGGIIMWSGSVASIPAGWYLCNGANGTPDLRNRFVVGAGSSFSPGGTGGSNDAVVVSHTHSFSGTTGTTNIDHVHDTNVLRYSDGTGTYASAPSGKSVSGKVFSAGASGTYNTVGTDGMYSNTTHSHSFSGTTSSAGSSGTNANMPLYYALAYIMKS